MAESSFEEMLNKITSDPSVMAKISEIAHSSGDDIMNKLPQVIDIISPKMTEEKNTANDEKTDTPADEKAASPLNLLNQIPLPLNKIGEKISKNSNLLIALKPYLSKERSNIIDSIVKMAQVANLMKNAK